MAQQPKKPDAGSHDLAELQPDLVGHCADGHGRL